MEFLDAIYQHLVIWAPSVTAIFGIVATVLLALRKVGDAVRGVKEDKDLKELRADNLALRNELRESTRVNKMLLDKITKIENYAETQQ